jgi:[ribosomal protein S18]-alanine N-acetyltransferase
MSLWPFAREEQAIVREAAPGDRGALSLLLARTWRRHGSASLDDQIELLHNGLSTISVSQGEAHGFFGLHLREPAGPDNETWADLNLAAIEVGGRLDGTMTAMTKATVPALRQAGASGIVCLAPPGWLHDGLLRAGFKEEDQVITFAHTDSRRVLPSEAPAAIRPARPADADAVLEVNALSFGPFWQYDNAVVLSWMLTSDRSVLALVDGTVAGFAITATGLAGNYAHLIRVATAPNYRGLGIGRQLVVDSIRFARELGSPGLALNTQASNRVSRSLYESLGFRQTGHALVVMVYRL